ncbi:hypothetical protein FQP34_27165 [Peribacillus simplex]|uniref:YxiJ-like protein n=1 Tax=Peribacillus simplex TaxID=1478 RepID=A0A8B5XS80_9BACI|nr:YxiJ family protein [Peribacillus simplex]TVX75704.1 hypothetical protein FQP34_27165 [Peribacillus simplex]
MFNVDRLQLYKELETLKESLYNPFPYRDIDKIQEDFNKELTEDDYLTADLNAYWMNIVGSLSYALKGNAKSIPKSQIEWLHFSFFDIFQQYRFLKEIMVDYPILYEEYMNNEKVRLLLLKYLSSQ